MPMVASATVQTTARQPLLMASGPTASIAMAGSQYSVKTSHRLDRMSRDSQVVASDFIPRTAASARSRQFYNLECGPESSVIAGGSRAIRKAISRCEAMGRSCIEVAWSSRQKVGAFSLMEEGNHGIDLHRASRWRSIYFSS